MVRIPWPSVVLYAGLLFTAKVTSAAPSSVDFPAVRAAATRWDERTLVVRLTRPAARRALLRPASEMRGGRVGIARVDAVAAALGAWLEPEFPGESAPEAPGDVDFSAFWIAHLPEGADAAEARRSLASLGEVAGVEPVAIVPVVSTPNDSLFAGSWYLRPEVLSGPLAWDVTHGDTSLTVAIIDTGVIPYHPDLAGTRPSEDHIWTNRAELAGVPGFDDDGNGYIDDTRGWDFVSLGMEPIAGEDSVDADNDPNDFPGHGTAVAGVVGAITGNRIGASGVAWDVKLMPLRVGWSRVLAASGSINQVFAAQAIRYATRMGANVINGSFSTQPQSDLAEAVAEAVRAGVTVVFAAGNHTSYYIQSRDDVIAVAATDESDRVALFSNLGDYVDLSAPGMNLSTTSIVHVSSDSIGLRQPTYTTGASGTSFSAPLVAGAAVLLQAQRLEHGLPLLTPASVHLRLTETTDDISAVNPGISGYGSGRLNLRRALTDPPTSWAARGGITDGAGVVVPGGERGPGVAWATSAGEIEVLDGASGAPRMRIPLGARPLGGIAAAPLGAGRGFGMFVALANGIIAGFDSSGASLAGWPVAAQGIRSGGGFEPALGDLDGDGTCEVVLGGADGTVYAWRADGTAATGFPRQIDDPTISARVALGDLDGQPGLEIVAAFANGNVHVLTRQGIELWPHVDVGGAPFAPVIGHFGPHATPHVVIALVYQVIVIGPEGSQKWIRSPRGLQATDPIVADLDGDGSDEVLLSHRSPPEIYAYDGRGVALAGWPKALPGLPDGSVIVGNGHSSGGRTIVQHVAEHGLVAFDSTGTFLGSLTRRGRAGQFPSIAELDGDGRSELLAGAPSDSLLYLYDLGPDTWRTAPQAWPAPRAGDARTGQSPRTPAERDLIPPEPIEDLAVSQFSATRVSLHWSAPRDANADDEKPTSYELRYSKTPLTEENFIAGDRLDPMPWPGIHRNGQDATISGLEPRTRYYFAIRSYDHAGNISRLSSVVSIATSDRALEAITDLATDGGTDTSVWLRWTAIGEEAGFGRPRDYRIHVSATTLHGSNFENAEISMTVKSTVDAGGTERVEVPGLEFARPYWFAVQSEMDELERSPISNVVQATAGLLIHLETFRVKLVPGGIVLDWATDPSPRTSTHLIGYRIARLDPGESGHGVPVGPDVITGQSFYSSEIRRGGTYVLSAVSRSYNTAEIGRASLPVGGKGIESWPSPATAAQPVIIRFAAPLGASSPVVSDLEVDLIDLQGRRVARLARGSVPAALGVVTLAWDGRTESGDRPAPGVYLITVRSASAGVRWTSRFVIAS